MSLLKLLIWSGLVLLIGGLSARSLFADELADKFEKKQFKNADSQMLLYRFLQPAKLEAGQKYPLVLFLHGAGERGDDNTKPLVHGVKTFATPEFLTKFPCFVVVPQCPENTKWTDIDWTTNKVVIPEQESPTAKLVMQCLDGMEKEFPIDLHREYVTGLSMGGFGTWDAISRHPQRFAAVVPVCGGCDLSQAKKIAHVPAWTFHGDKDQVVKVERTREIVEALKAAGGNPKYTEYPGVGHDSWNGAYKDRGMYDWLFAQRRK
ncbi:MAG: prolyl oligopeptidase family serine peptidase [Planctomycetaceae bacterium]|nr:prolyl oligopeptidase family serine peptidase [Planctomycetaceae bacterium]